MPGYEKTPFVMVTAEAEQEQVVKAIKAGSTDYIVKPFAAEALEARIKMILTRFVKKAA
jgi:two-component system chemotaxis response regulator CheY